MTRLSLHLALILTAAAAVNLAVAWACVAFAPVTRTALASDRWPGGSPAVWVETAPIERRLGLGVEEYEAAGYAFQRDEPGARSGGGATTHVVPFFTRTLVRAGWPLRALRCERWERINDPVVRANAPGILLSGVPRESLAPPPSSAAPVQYASRFPLVPDWPRFALNLLIYGAPLWLLLGGPRLVRRRQRRRRAQCEVCGYPIGISPVCTECGRAVIAPAASTANAQSPH